MRTMPLNYFGPPGCTNAGSSTTTSGSANKIWETTTGSFIGGGTQNEIATTGNTTRISFNTIFGGNCNCILSGDNNVIYGGQCNLLSGSFNAILGGQCNCDNGHSFVGIFGCHVVANRDNAFFANNFVAQNMASGAGGAVGELYFTATSGRALFINP